MVRRNKAKPPITLPIWKPEGKFWYVERETLEAAIRDCGVSEYLIQQRMGVGYAYIEKALNGERLDGWAVAHIEWGIKPGISDLERSAELAHEKFGKKPE